LSTERLVVRLPEDAHRFHAIRGDHSGAARIAGGRERAVGTLVFIEGALLKSNMSSSVAAHSLPVLYLLRVHVVGVDHVD